MTTADATPGIVTEFAPAKINLTLHITGQREDGYHLLDSLAVFADIGDVVSIRRANGLRLSVTGPRAGGVPDDGTNLVLRAARLAGVTNADITLDKHLPSAAGIGGGSSDAAAALRAFCVSHGSAEPTTGMALELGADVPICLAAKPVRMTGIGDRVALVGGWPDLPAVLVNPGVSLPTPSVFRSLAKKDNPPMADVPSFGDVPSCVTWLRHQRNDLEKPAIGICPPVGPVLAQLHRHGALLARMSGSGATCFGIFETLSAARRACEQLSLENPGWWVQPTVLRGSDSQRSLDRSYR